MAPSRADGGRRAGDGAVRRLQRLVGRGRFGAMSYV
jgi:hypothetical protein